MSRDDTRAARPLLLLAAAALAVSLLLRGALNVSANPVEGEVAYDVTAWLSRLLHAGSVGLFAAWAAVRTLLRALRPRDSSTRS